MTDGLTDRMREVLATVVEHDARGLQYRSSIGTTATCQALARRGLVREDKAASAGYHQSHYWHATDDGRAAVEARQ